MNTTSAVPGIAELVGPPGPNQQAYAERWQRIADCIRLQRPKRMPVAMYATYWLATYGGISYKQLMYDAETCAEIAERAVLEF